MCRGLLWFVLVASTLKTVAAGGELALLVEYKRQTHDISFDKGEFEEAKPLTLINSDHACVIPFDIFLRKIVATGLNQDILTTGIWREMSIENSNWWFKVRIVGKPHVGYRRPAMATEETKPTDLAYSNEKSNRWIVSSQETADEKVVVIGGNVVG